MRRLRGYGGYITTDPRYEEVKKHLLQSLFPKVVILGKKLPKGNFLSY